MEMWFSKCPYWPRVQILCVSLTMENIEGKVQCVIQYLIISEVILVLTCECTVYAVIEDADELMETCVSDRESDVRRVFS